MPQQQQQQQRRSAEEILGLAPQRRSAEEILGIRPAKPETSQPSSTARRLGIQPAEGMRFDLRGPSQPASRKEMEIAPRVSRDQLLAGVADQMREREMKEGAIAEARARLGKLPDAELGKEHARLSKIFATVPETRQARLEEERRRAEYYSRPFYKRMGQEADVALAGVGEAVNRAASRVAQPVMRAVGLDEAADAWSRASAKQSRIHAERQEEQERIANRLPSKITRGLTSGGAQALIMAPVAMTTGPVGVTALTALESDVERDPGGALASTIAAPVSMAAGKFVSPRAARVASGFASKPAQKAAQVGIEGLSGAGANVGQYAATSAALGRPITAGDLAEQAVTGAGLSVPFALKSLRQPAGARPARADRATMEIEASPLIRATGPAADEAAIRARLEQQGAETATPAMETVEAQRRAPEPQRLPFDAEAPRKLQHSRFGEVTEAADQSGVRSGQLRVIDGEGKPHVIRNPRTVGNKEAAFVTEREEALRGVTELPELSAIEDTPIAPGLSVREAPMSAAVSGPRAMPDIAPLSLKPPASPRSEPHSLGKAIGSALRTGSQAMRTLWTSMDLSAPLSQGAILSIAHPFKSGVAFGKMLRSLSKKQSDAIDAEIMNHPLLALGEDSGLYVATSGKAKGAPEEFYSVEALNKLPGIRHSERTFRTYLDSLRLSTWESYVKALQRAGFTPETNPQAYRDAAAFINIATGRGSLKPGGKLEKAMDLGGDVLFAPRNLVARFQVLDPVRYATLVPGARKVVLRDAMTAFGAMLSTAALLRAAGVQVGFDPTEDDFMTARWGDTRYDLTFGLRPQAQFLARVAAGVYRTASGEGNLPGKDPLSVSERYIRGKIAPLYSTGLTFLTGRDFKGEPVKDKSAGKIAWETAAPLLWRDLAEAYHAEGIPGVAKSSPAIFGARVSTYPDRPKSDWLQTRAEVRAEQKRLGLKRDYLTPRKGESVEQFKARKQAADKRYTDVSAELVSSPDYQRLDSDVKREAFDVLREGVGRGDRGELIVENVIARAMDRVEKRKAAQK